MANEQLKTALRNAGLTTETFADIISVDPKTVQRWLSGRTPYARHRVTISRALDIPEHELWTELGPGQEAEGGGVSLALTGAGDLHGYASSDADDAPDLAELLTGEITNVDLLDRHGWLLERRGVLSAIETLATQGARVRVMAYYGDLNPDYTPPKPAADVDVRDAAVYPPYEILRVDDRLLLFLAIDALPPFVFDLSRQNVPTVFDRLLGDYDARWDEAEPVDENYWAATALADREWETPADAADSMTPPENPPAGNPPRRWPRRPN